MMPGALSAGGLHEIISALGHFIGAVLSFGAFLWIARSGDRERPDRGAILVACAMTAIWCALGALAGPLAAATVLAASLRNLAFIFVIFRLFALDGRDESLRPTRPVIITLALVELLQPVLIVVFSRVGFVPQLAALTFELSIGLNMLVAVGTLVLLHNLYAGAAPSSRELLRWSAIALAGIFAYDLNLYTIAYLGGQLPAALMVARGVFCGVMLGLVALGAGSRLTGLTFRPSRAVTFQTLSLLVIGSYLLLMVLITRSLALIGGDIARASQIVFLIFAVVLAIISLPSARMRGWLRVTATKHLFQHRYDYREEWLRFTRTIGRGGSSASASFHERAIKAIADITESPAGLLLVPDEEAQLELTARWNWSMIEVPAIAGGYALSGLLEHHNYILDLDEVRAGIDHHGERAHVPQWLIEAEDAWALVPLIHFDRLIGCIVLARPRIMRGLDWEDFDLLRVVGQQLASYLAEQAGQQALMDASRFDEFNRRMAFVMHDIKNLASQLSLLATNAEKHAEKPAFRADMLVTLRKSSEKLNALLARLGRYGGGQVEGVSEVDLAALARSVADRFKGAHPVNATAAGRTVRVLANAEALEQALLHLVQNAVDASDAALPVFLRVSQSGAHGEIEVIDSGCGMSPEFIRTGLFKPFVSSKQGGFGIGAFEARELIRAMGGRLLVESREGLGTRFTVLVPVPESARLFSESRGEEPAKTTQQEAV